MSSLPTKDDSSEPTHDSSSDSTLDGPEAPLAALDTDDSDLTLAEDGREDDSDATAAPASHDSSAHNSLEEDATEPPEAGGDSSDEGTLGAGSVESLNDDSVAVTNNSSPRKRKSVNFETTAGTDADTSFMSAVDDPGDDVSSGTECGSEFSGDDLPPDASPAAAAAVSGCVSESDQYLTAAEDGGGGNASSASRNTNPFLSCESDHFLSALSSGGEESDGGSAAKKRNINLLRNRAGYRQFPPLRGNSKDGSGEDYLSACGGVTSASEAEFMSCDESGAAAAASSGHSSQRPPAPRKKHTPVQFVRPDSIVSTSSAEYLTPGYYSTTGDSSEPEEAGLDSNLRRLIADAGSDSELSEFDDFTLKRNPDKPQMTASNSNSGMKQGVSHNAATPSSQLPPVPSRLPPSNGPRSTAFSPIRRRKSYFGTPKMSRRSSSLRRNKSGGGSFSERSSARKAHRNQVGGTPPAAAGKRGFTPPVHNPGALQSAAAHSAAIAQAEHWLSTTNRKLEHGARHDQAIKEADTWLSHTLQGLKPEPDQHKLPPADSSGVPKSEDMNAFDPFGASVSPDKWVQFEKSESKVKTPLPDDMDGLDPFGASPAFTSEPKSTPSSPTNPFDNTSAPSSNPFAVQSSDFNPFSDLECSDMLDSSANPLVIDVDPKIPHSTSVLDNLSPLSQDQSLLTAADANDPLMCSDPLADSAAPLVFKKGPLVEQAPPSDSARVFQPIEEDHWMLMMRFPVERDSFIQKSRRWVTVDVRLDRESSLLRIFDNHRTGTETPWEEILVSNRLFIHDVKRQKYDERGKVHTFKLVETSYRRRNQFDKILASTIFQQPLESKYIAEHRIRAKFGTTDLPVVEKFMKVFGEYQFINKTVKNLHDGLWTHPEVHLEVVDTCKGTIDQAGEVTSETISVAIYCLAFLVRAPEIRIGINDETVKGNEVVRRTDILPMKSDAWIKFDDVRFHHTVDQALYTDDRSIVFQPMDGCQYKLAQLSVLDHFYKEQPIKPIIKIGLDGPVVNIKAEFFLPSIQKLDFKFDAELRRCEDILLVIPVPDSWVGMLRHERFLLGEGSVKAAKRKTGYVSKTKAHGVKIQVTAGVAKYESAYKAIVWRIKRLPGNASVTISSYAMQCQLVCPDGKAPPFNPATKADLSYSMAWTVASGTVIRSMAITNLPVTPLRKVNYRSDFSYTVDIHRMNEFDA